MGGKMSPEWWRERYRSMTPEQRSKRVKQSNDCRRESMEKNPEYRERWLKKQNDAMRAKRDDPDFRSTEAEKMYAYRHSNPHIMERERLRAQQRRLRNSAAHLVRGAKSRSKKNGVECDLTVEWAQERWTGKCELTGIEFRPALNRQTPYSPSIDRIDPTKGYMQANCRFILSAINYLKHNGTDEEMFHIAAELIARRFRRG